MTKKPIDVGDEKQVKELKTKLELAREREIGEFRAILETEAGRAFVWRILEKCKIYDTSVVHELATFVALGEKNIGSWLINEVFTSDLGAFTLMMQEHQERMRDGQ